MAKLSSIEVGGNNYTFEYDVCGNQIRENQERQFQWDYADRMKLYYNQVNPGQEPSTYTHYLYDAGGNRVKKLTRVSGGNWECITYIDGLIEYREDHNGQQQSISHIMDDSKRIASVRNGFDFGDSTPAIKYNMDDHLGSSNLSVDTNGTLVNREEYYPFGETSFGSYAKKRYRFCGKEKDEESGLYYYGARYYSPWTCRFISVDPLAGDYPFYTPYQYAGNKPINFIDLDGEEEKPPQINRPIDRDWRLSTDRKGALGQVGNFFSGLYNVLMGTLGALSELPGQAHYGHRVKPKDQNATFPLTAGQNFQTLFVGAIVAPIIAVGEFVKDPTFGKAGELVGTVFMYKSVAKLGVSKIPKVNIALGRYARTGTKADLKSFAEANKAKHSHDWEAAGLFKKEEVQGFGEAFKQVMDKVKETKGQIFFDLTDLNIKDALAGDPSLFVGRYTAWELQQVVRDPNLFARTKFYLNGIELNKTQLNNLGIKLQKTN